MPIAPKKIKVKSKGGKTGQSETFRDGRLGDKKERGMTGLRSGPRR